MEVNKTQVTTYYVDYCNGLSTIEVYGSLFKAQSIADEYVKYTKKDIMILDKQLKPVSIRKWYGVDFNDEPDDICISDPIVIGNGYYADWEDFDKEEKEDIVMICDTYYKEIEYD